MPTPSPRPSLPPVRGSIRLRPVDPGGRARLQCRVAADITAAFLGISAAEILSERRARAPVARARHISMYLAHVAFELPLATVAGGFGRDRTSISYAVARIEDERDNRDFDRHLTAMEQLARSCRQLAVPGAGEEGV